MYVCMAYDRPCDQTMPWGVEDMEPEDLLAQLCASGVSADGFEVDLGQADGPRRLFRLAREMFGRVEILVNNAAYSTRTHIKGMTAEDLDLHCRSQPAYSDFIMSGICQRIHSRRRWANYQSHLWSRSVPDAKRTCVCRNQRRS